MNVKKVTVPDRGICHGNNEAQVQTTVEAMTEFLVSPPRTGIALRLPNGQLWALPSLLDAGVSYPTLVKDEVFQLISSAGLPVAGHGDLPSKTWLPEPVECLEEEGTSSVELIPTTVGGYIMHFPETLEDATKTEYVYSFPLAPLDVYVAIGALLNAYYPVALRLRRKQVFTRGAYDDAQTAANRHAMLVKVFDEMPLAKAVSSGGVETDLFLLECEIRQQKFGAIADFLDQGIRRNHSADQTLESFIRGPLPDCYRQLFGVKDGRSDEGEFALFGHCFFRLVGHPVAPGTIVRYLNRRSKRPAKHRFPRGAGG